MTSELGPGGHEAGGRGYRRVVTAMTAAGIATFAQLYAVQAVLPGLAEGFDASASTVALTVSFATGGLAMFVLVWSGAADRFGRVPVMTTALVVSTVLGLVAPIAPDITTLMVIRALQGAALGGVPAVAMAYLAEEIHPAHLARVAGLYIAGNTVGGMSGRLVAGAVSDVGGWRWGIAADSLLALVALIVYLVAVPPAAGFTPRQNRRTDRSAGREGPSTLTRLVGAFRDPGMIALYLQGLLLMGAFVTIYNYLGFHMMAPPFLLSPTLVAFLFVAYLAGTVSSAVVGRAIERLGRHRVLVGSLAFMLCGVLLLVMPAFAAIAVGLLVLTFFFFAVHTTASAWVGHRAAPGSRAQAAGLYTLAYYTGSSVLGWVGGLFYEHSGWTAVVGYVVALCVGAGVATVALRPRRG
ncbi:MFS transporter [Spiractinospora alimapuensis]|uniref:MFS transporter n=1 Tax=Spiractinospora alimapuensis TaxID=2820884 RepID=UPI001F2624D0|nr:MFS transporter [Spiractinospora alimapuensis]